MQKNTSSSPSSQPSKKGVLLEHSIKTIGLSFLLGLCLQTHLDPHTYTVKQGDTLNSISKKYNNNKLTTLFLNPSKLFSRDQIYPGDEISVSGAVQIDSMDLSSWYEEHKKSLNNNIHSRQKHKIHKYIYFNRETREFILLTPVGSEYGKIYDGFDIEQYIETEDYTRLYKDLMYFIETGNNVDQRYIRI